MFDRRSLMTYGAAFGATLGATLGLAPRPSMAQATLNPALSIQDLWPGDPPGGEKVTAVENVVLRHPGGDPNDTAFYHVRKPWLLMRRPAKPNGASMLIMPGGGYVRVAVSKAGGDIDAWLAEQGITAFVMNYRLPADGWAAGPDVALQDAQRAIRLIRSRAAELGLDPDRVGIAGFSAGGHVAGLLATRFAEKSYEPVDAADQLSARPTVAAMMYPVVTATLPYAHQGSVKELLGPMPTDEARKHSSLELHVPADAPPTYVGGTTNDPVVPMQNAMLMYAALQAAKIPTELHLYEGATHGFPLKDKGGNLLPWGPQALDFMLRHGLGTVPAKA